MIIIYLTIAYREFGSGSCACAADDGGNDDSSTEVYKYRYSDKVWSYECACEQ